MHFPSELDVGHGYFLFQPHEHFQLHNQCRCERDFKIAVFSVMCLCKIDGISASSCLKAKCSSASMRQNEFLAHFSDIVLDDRA